MGALVFPAASGASVTFGPDLAAPATLGLSCNFGCTLANTALPAGSAPVTSPISGTIIRWRIRTGSLTTAATVALRVIAPTGSATFVGAGTGTTVGPPPASTTTTYPEQLPIDAGDYIGVNSEAGKALNAIAQTITGAVFTTFSPALADGGTPATGSNNSGKELLINADVAAPPTSAAGTPSACPGPIILPVTVTPDPDPAVAAKAVHYVIDGGAEQVVATSGDPATANVPLPTGSHTLEYWGEDTVGQSEAAHHTATVNVPDCATSPTATPTLTPGPTVTPTVALTPVVSSARLSTSVFRAAGSGGSLARAPVGTTVSYRDSLAATTTFKVLKRVTGHRKGHRCVAGAPKRHQKRCTRYVSVGSFIHLDQAGAVQVRFTGRVHGHKLKPGRYRLTLTPRAGGKTGKAVVLPFRIVK
jgi:hypothetical protein